MDLGIAGKVALVSGASKGMGRCTAEMLAAEGAHVVVVARGAEAVHEAVRAITDAGGIAVGAACDMTTPEGVRAAVGTARDTFGPPDIAVSNVHGPGPGNFFDLTAEDFAQAFDEMVLSVVRLSQAVVPDMQAKGWGRLVNIGSGAAKEPPPELAHLLANTTRAPVATLQKSLANEFSRFGITVNTVASGWIGTQRMWDYVESTAAQHGTTSQALMDSFAAKIPAGRPGKPEELAATVVFLCSELAGYITGQFILVDGGFIRSAL